jgi:hypothetical protein
MSGNPVNWADGSSPDLAPPGLGPLRDLAEGAEFTEAVSVLVGADGHRLPGDHPLASDLTNSLSRPDSPCTAACRTTRCPGSAASVCFPLRTVTPTVGMMRASWCPGQGTIFCRWTGPAMAPTEASRT